jgi:phosphohistidine swiveling domain-containing protein
MPAPEPAGVIPLQDLTPDLYPFAGGKAANCARLRRAGFPVPGGLVVLSTASESDVAATATHSWFSGLPSTCTFAVRSSGLDEDGEGESFAGVHRTVLNVSRDEVGAAVAACRASAYESPAVEYRRRRGLGADAASMGVLVQYMVDPLTAGVAFTINPVTGADTEVVINASWGLGEALVSGQVDPDEIVVRKRDTALVWSRIGEKASSWGMPILSLTTEQAAELTRILLRIEAHYGAPQDVEWCWDGELFWIVQSRPVTTVRRVSARDVEWTRANLVEVLPDVTSPQACAAFEDVTNRAERQYLGPLVASDAAMGPMVKSFHGRLYFNLSQLRRVCAIGGTAPAEMLRSMGHADAIAPSDERPAPVTVTERLAGIPQLLRIVSRHLRAAHIVRDHETQMRELGGRLESVTPEGSDEAIWRALDVWNEAAPSAMQAVLLLSGVLVHEAPVRALCRRVGFSYERLVYPQLATGDRSVSAQQAFDLVALAATARRDAAAVLLLGNPATRIDDLRAALRGSTFLAALERFLQDYGHRGRYEYDWSLPRYREDPTPILEALRLHLQAGQPAAAEETAARQARESAEAWNAFTATLSIWRRWTVLPRVRAGIARIKRYYVWREQVRSDIVRLLEQVRAHHLVLAARFVERGWLATRDDYFLLRLEEVAASIANPSRAGTLKALVAERHAELARYRATPMPLLMRESELARLCRTSAVSDRSADPATLTGHPVSGGCVEADVVVVADPADFARMRRGAILVAPATDPSWTPLFTLASGVIVEVGGVLSHASTIAREYGLPALANVRDATRRLRTGDRVRLDADNGRIIRVSGDCRAAVLEGDR